MAVEPIDAPAPPYPAHWESDVVLADGGTMHVRPIRPDDGDRLVRFHERQSPESIYFRYFSFRPQLSAREVDRLTTVDYVDRMAFVGLLGDELIGVARYDRPPALSEAEVAFFTDDSHTGRGMATVLLEYLAAAAREVGISAFKAQVLPQNLRMLSVFKQAGFAVSSHFADGVVEVELAIEPTPAALAAMEQRATLSDARSVGRVLAPRSVAVVGASRRAGTLGHAVFRRLLDGGFEGPVYPVNPEARHVASVRSYPSLLDVPDEIDLAVLVVPAEQVPEVVAEAGRKHVHGLVVLSAGFADAGPDGAARERTLVEQARGLGMRLVGPNTMGVINTAPDVQMHASFTDVIPRPGRIGVSSQSGTIGAAVLDHLCAHGLGISSFVATGNKGDVSGNDLLQYWEQDDRTDVVVLYLESFGNPRNFGRIARRISQRKPVVAVKAGRTTSGGSDTDPSAGATSAAAVDVDWPVDATFDALLRQTGVIRVDTLEQLTDVTRVLARQPLPAGPRVAVLSNFGGPAVLAADAFAGAGLVLAEIGVDNPRELSAQAGPLEYATATRSLLAHPGVDALMVLHAPPLVARTAEVVRAVAAVAAEADHKPVVAVFLGPNDPDAFEGVRSLPIFAFPEGAVYALGRVTGYAAWRREPLGALPDFDGCDAGAARSKAEALLVGLGAAGRWLEPVEAAAVLETYGVVPVRQQLVHTEDEARRAAAEIGYPVALKAYGLARPAKTEAGGVAVDVHGDDELRAAYERMTGIHGPAMQPALVQAMAPTGIDVAVGLHQHPALGSVVTLGLAGIDAVELRILPLTDADVDRLAGTIPELEPGGGRALADLLLRLSALADAVPEIAVLGLDPIMVSEAGAFPTNIRMHLAPWTRAPPQPFAACTPDRSPAYGTDMRRMKPALPAALGMLLVLALAACSSDTTDTANAGTTTVGGSSTTTTSVPAPSMTITKPQPEGSPGCGKAPDPGPTDEDSGDVTQTITSGGVERTYRLEVPSPYKPDQAMPLIFNFHGAGSNAVQQSVYSRLPKVARGKGIIVVTPDAVRGLWKPAGPPGTPESPDITFVKDLVADINNRYCVDQARVFATGISLGSAYSASVVCALPETFAAAGLVALNALPDPCEPVPVVVFHGDEDQVVPYESEDAANPGQPTGTVKNMGDWATLDGCSTEPVIDKVGSDVERRTYPDCKGGTEVVLYTVIGGGHTWPGAEVSIGSTTQTIDATEVILDFFAKHPKAPT